MPRRRKEIGDNCRSGIREKPQRNAANARERARMRILSRAFSRLKTTLPWVPADTKLSKLDTLRLATSYIAHLKALITDDMVEIRGNQPINPAMTLTWPFNFPKTNEKGEKEVPNSQQYVCAHFDDVTAAPLPMDRYFSDELCCDYEYYEQEMLPHG